MCYSTLHINLSHKAHTPSFVRLLLYQLQIPFVTSLFFFFPSRHAFASPTHSPSTATSTRTQGVMATSQRTAAAGADWREVFLSEQDIAGARSLAEAVQLGHSLLLLDQVATPEECADLLAESEIVAARVRAEHFPSAGSGGETDLQPACSDGVDDSALALPPAACLMLSNSSRIRIPVRNMLSVRAQVSLFASFTSGAGAPCREPWSCCRHWWCPMQLLLTVVCFVSAGRVRPHSCPGARLARGPRSGAHASALQRNAGINAHNVPGQALVFSRGAGRECLLSR